MSYAESLLVKRCHQPMQSTGNIACYVPFIQPGFRYRVL